MDNDFFHEMVIKICNDLNIKYSFHSNDWIIMLKKDNIIKFIAGYKFDLNSHSLGCVLDDKFALYDVLKSQNIDIIEHNIVYGVDNKNKYALNYSGIDYVSSLFEKYNRDVVLKVNNGTCGVNVYHITDKNELGNIYLRIGGRNNSLSLCPYYDIENEFRCIILDGEIKLLYKKIRPVVVGDGKSTIKELLVKFNANYFKKIDDDSLDVILEKDKEFMYDWKFNLSRGAILSEDIDERDYLNVSSLALKVSKLLNLGFCSVDVIKCDGKYHILEINSGVMMKNYIKIAENGYSKAYEIYHDAIVKMFN